MWNDTLEKKSKYYQGLKNYKLAPGCYIILHLDGRAFSSYTKGMRVPFDDEFIDAMNQTAIHLCKEVGNCKFAYTQSDEISLILCDWNTEKDCMSDMWLHNRISKICSITASMASVKFYHILLKKYSSKTKNLEELLKKVKEPQFDCKAWDVPTWWDAYAWLSFRNIDCIRNSITMVAQSEFSHRQLEKLNSDQRKEKLLKEKGISWENDFDDGKKYGRFIWREATEVIGKNGQSTIRSKFNIHPGFPLVGEEGLKNFEKLNSIPRRE